MEFQVHNKPIVFCMYISHFGMNVTKETFRSCKNVSADSTKSYFSILNIFKICKSLLLLWNVPIVLFFNVFFCNCVWMYVDVGTINLLKNTSWNPIFEICD